MWSKKLAIALIAGAAFVAEAQSANVATEFSVGSNPGGAWSYGWAPSLQTGFDLALFNWTFGSGPNVAGGWSVQDPSILPDANPSVLWLNNGSGPLFSYSTISAPSRSVNLHPGANGELAVVRWTVPTAGEYLISGAFRGNDVSGTTTDVHVLHNNVALLNGAVNGFDDKENFSHSVFLQAGDRLDFAVGTGGNGFFNDSTGLSAIISAVPEPSSYAMLFAGLGVIGVIARRRRQSAAA